MKRIESGAVPVASHIAVEHIRDKDVFDADLTRLDKLNLGAGLRTDERARRYLHEFKQLGRAYVRVVMQFNADRTRASAENLFRLSKTIRGKISQAQFDYPEEPAFSRTSARPIAEDKEKMPAVEHVGTIFNSMFATFASSTFFPDYLKHYAVIERESASEGVKVNDDIIFG